MKEKEYGDIISEEEYKQRLADFQQFNPDASGQFRSTGRAARRGHLLKSGMIVPRRPHHNRANTSRRKGAHSRGDNELRKEMWSVIKGVIRDGEQ